ncbi:MAG: glycosyltransferase [Lutibacter sp.]|nr:glycosyltransferase [Lutibacter sp.]
MKNLVSVIINCYNGEEFLSLAIDSVLTQTYENWELIFYDNCSTDKSKEIFLGYKNEKFRYYKSEKLIKLYNARNNAILKSKGDFYSFIDVDDLWFPEKLELQMNTFKDKEVGISCGNFILIDERNIYNKISAPLYDFIPSGFVIDNLLSKYFIHMSSLVIRKTAYYSLNKGFNSNYTIVGDIDLVVRLNLNWKLSSIQKPITYYRYHRNNTGNKESHLISNELKLLYHDLLNNYPVITKKSNFNLFEKKVYWHIVVSELENNFKVKALKNIYKLSTMNKLKLLLSLLIPFYIIKLYIKRRSLFI